MGYPIRGCRIDVVAIRDNRVTIRQAIEMTMPKPDVPLLRKVCEWAKSEDAKPDKTECEWLQDHYVAKGARYNRVCESVYCIAGYTVETIDGPIERAPEGWAINTTAVHHRARELLGLTLDEAGALFEASNTIEDVLRSAEQIAQRAGESL